MAEQLDTGRDALRFKLLEMAIRAGWETQKCLEFAKQAATFIEEVMPGAETPTAGVSLTTIAELRTPPVYEPAAPLPNHENAPGQAATDAEAGGEGKGCQPQPPPSAATKPPGPIEASVSAGEAMRPGESTGASPAAAPCIARGDLDADIRRLHEEGKTPKEIAGLLSAEAVKVSFGSVYPRLNAMGLVPHRRAFPLSTRTVADVDANRKAAAKLPADAPPDTQIAPAPENGDKLPQPVSRRYATCNGLFATRLATQTRCRECDAAGASNWTDADRNLLRTLINRGYWASEVVKELDGRHDEREVFLEAQRLKLKWQGKKRRDHEPRRLVGAPKRPADYHDGRER